MNSYANISEIINNARSYGVAFDIESTGFYSGQDMFSATTQTWSQKKPHTAWFNVDVKKASYFGLTNHERMFSQHIRQFGNPPKFTTYDKFGEEFLNLIRSSKNHPSFVISHNGIFDLSFIYESLHNNKELRKKYQRAFSGTDDYQIGRLQRLADAYERQSKTMPKRLKTLIKQNNYSAGKITSGGGSATSILNRIAYSASNESAVSAYQRYIEIASNAKNRNLVFNVDTNELSKLFIGLAAENGLIGSKKAIGSKLELISEAIGIDTAMAHTDLDVPYTKSLLDVYQKGDIDSLARSARSIRGNDYKLPEIKQRAYNSLSSEGKNILEMFKLVSGEIEGKTVFDGLLDLPFSKYTDYRVYSQIGQDYVDFYSSGSVPLGTTEGRKISSSANTVGELITARSRQYNKSETEISQAWEYYNDLFHQNTTDGRYFDGLRIDYNKASKVLHDRDAEIMSTIKKNIKDHIKPIARDPLSVKTPISSNTVKEVFSSKAFKVSALTIAGITAASTLFALFSQPHRKDKDKNHIYSQKIPGHYNEYSQIEGLHPGNGVNKYLTQTMTDFGSGYQGPNPQLNPSYNEAKDVYKYEWMRSSQIGLSEEELYKYMTEEKNFGSEYVAASANAGTALHEYLGAVDFKQGRAIDTERLVLDYQNKISGHIDIIRNDLGVGDYKTVSGGIFRAIQKQGKPKDMHRSQVMFYLGQTGQTEGFIQYINRENIKQQKVFKIKFNPDEYERLIAKVERVRARVMTDLAVGRLKKSQLPMAAGPETLLEADAERLSPDEQVREIDNMLHTYYEEMDYLKNVKRGMPNVGSAGYSRIQNRNKKKGENMMGVNFQIYNNRNQHHVM